MKILKLLVIVLLFEIVLVVYGFAADTFNNVIKVGYFHGARSAILMRMHENDVFQQDGLKVKILTKNLLDENFYSAPKSIKKLNRSGRWVGKVNPVELIEGLKKEKFNFIVLDEGAFVKAITEGEDVVAIARLGYDLKKKSGHVLLKKRNISLSKSGDFLGKLLVTRKGKLSDQVFLKKSLEFLEVDLSAIKVINNLPTSRLERASLPDDKILLVNNVPENLISAGLETGIIDAGYFPLMKYEDVRDDYEILLALHQWMDPGVSQALLVSNTKWLNSNEEKIVQFLKSYIKRVKFEQDLPYELRIKKDKKGRQMSADVEGLDYPQYSDSPLVDESLLIKIMKVLFEYGVIEKEVGDMKKYVDNQYVYRAIEGLKKINEY